MTGIRIPADEAYRIGLVKQVVPREDLNSAKGMAAVMCSKNKFGLRMA